MKKKSAFDVTDDGGVELKLAVVLPSVVQKHKAEVISSKTFKEVIETSILRSELEEVLRKKGIWNDAKQKRLEDLQYGLIAAQRKLDAGGFRLTEGYDLAVQMIKDRSEIRTLNIEHGQLDSNTVEGQCENAKFNFLVSVCTVYNDTGKAYFSTYENYIEHSDETVAQTASLRLMALLYDFDDNVIATYPETQFLRKYNFINEKLQFVNKQGHLCTSDGRLVDEKGRFVDADGHFIDLSGNAVDENGSLLIESKPFLDDDDNPIA